MMPSKKSLFLSRMPEEQIESNNAGTSKKFPRVILFSIIVVLLLLLRFAYAEDPPFEPVLKQAASEVNKTCPQNIDSQTILDSVSVHENKTFRYNYTLTDLEKDSIDVEMFVLSVEPLMLNNAKTNPDLELFRSNQVNLEYYFRDSKGQFVTRISVGPDKYSN